jgi:hypothetical protein
MLVQLPNSNDGLPANVGVSHCHGIRGSELALDAVVSGLFGVSSPPSIEVALCLAEKTKFEKYSKGVRSRPDSRLIPFAITEFGSLGGHATAFLTQVAKYAAASKGMHVGKFFTSWRRKVSLVVHDAHADSVLRGLSAAAYGVEAASSFDGICLLPLRRSSPAPRAASVPVLPRAAREAPLVASTCCILGMA